MKAKVNGTELYYEVSGNEGKPWLVLSHSLTCTVRMWDPQVAAFQDRFRILNYDMRGHGASAAPSGAYTLDMLADDVLGLMKELKIERATYMGLSIGGMIGQTLALRQTKLFDKMVLAPSTMERWFTPSFRESPPAQKIAQLIANTPVAGYVGCGQAIMKLNTTARLKEIKLPVLAIAGEQDPSAPGTRHIGETVPGAKLVLIPQAAHISNVEQAATFNQALRDF